MVEPCCLLEWDSRHFGVRVARAERAARSESEMNEIVEWCTAHEVDCLYYYCSLENRVAIQLACRRSFELVDVRIDLEISTSNSSETRALPHIRKAEMKDLPALRAIARASHHHSRFYVDGHFSRTASDRLYELWIERDFHASDAAVWIAEVLGQAVGYITCGKEEMNVGRIGLFAVASEYRGRGLGTDLLIRALQWFREEHCTTVRVSAQGANMGALRFYVRAGFIPRELGLWFHKWFRGALS